MNITNFDYFLRFGDFISSYKGHSIFAMILALLFFPNPISIAIAIIGANLPDFDHDVKKINLYRMEIIGLLLFIVLYIANLPYFIGIIFAILPVIFYFSKHRGFIHSLLGIAILSILIFSVFLVGIAILSPILSSLGLINQNFFSELIAISLMVMGLAILILNKRLIAPFLILFLLGILFLPDGLSMYYAPFYSNLYSYISIIGPAISYNSYKLFILILFPLFLGLLSHLILDSLTPSGIELFRPFSSKKVHKSFAIICLIFLGVFLFFIMFL